MTYKPILLEYTYTVPAGGSITETISLDSIEVKSIAITNAGADVTASFSISNGDGGTTLDLASEYGKNCLVDTITVNASNAGAADETVTIQIKGVLMVRR